MKIKIKNIYIFNSFFHSIKEILKEYMRIQKKIQYYSNEEHRKQKIIENIKNHNTNKEKYNLYQKLYQRNYILSKRALTTI